MISVSLWFWLILSSAVILGFYDLFKKQAVDGNSVMPALFFATLSGTVCYMLAAAVTGTIQPALSCSLHVFFLLVLKSVIVSLSWICVYYSLRELPLSIAAPIRATSPVWTLAGGILLYREIPTPVQAVGMAVIFAGYYAFSVLGKKEGIRFSRNKGIFLVILGTALGAGSALYDKYLLGVLHIPRAVVQFWFSADLVVLLGTAWGIRQLFGHKHPFRWRWSIPLCGISLIAADWLYFQALGEPGTQIAILSLLRRCNCIVAVAAAYFVYRDKNIKSKVLALLLILLGAAILALQK